MSHIWTFSPQSEVLLQQCLDAATATPTDESNKWLQLFGPKNLTIIKKLDTVTLEDSPDTEVNKNRENQDEEVLSVVEEFMDSDFDIVSNLDILQEKCSVKPKILTKLAENLPVSTIDKLIAHVFDTRDMNIQFLEHFFEYFLSAYIKKDNSRVSTDLLFKTYNSFAQYFKILLQMVLKDLAIQNNILNDFVLLLKSNDLSELLDKISSIELSGAEFCHHLFSIYTAYKNCNKTDSVQDSILSLLNTHSQFCATDKNYGKLLLAYLQQEKSLKRSTNRLNIERIVESHNSPFKRACLAILKEINTT